MTLVYYVLALPDCKARQSGYPATVYTKVDKDAVMGLPNRSNSMLISIAIPIGITVAANFCKLNIFYFEGKK